MQRCLRVLKVGAAKCFVETCKPDGSRPLSVRTRWTSHATLGEKYALLKDCP